METSQVISEAAEEAMKLVEMATDYQCGIDLICKPEGILVRGVLYSQQELGRNYTGFSIVTWAEIEDNSINALSEAVVNDGIMIGIKVQ